jgi:CO/xanthine dehydrogenase Mo-binding subunit
MVCVASAIANAIYNAIGVRMKELCITPEKILQALSESKGENLFKQKLIKDA